MGMNSENKLFWLPAAMFLFLVTAMTFASVFLAEKEIIFPEVAAIAAGALLSPKLCWQTDRRRIFISIMLCALLGMLIVRFLPGSAAFKMTVGYALSQLLLLLSGTSFVPMISAMVLPVLLNTATPLYLVSAAVFTALVLFFSFLLEISGLRPAVRYVPLAAPDTASFRDLFYRTLIAGAVIAAAQSLHLPFIAAPPLLVAFTEFAKPGSKAVKNPLPVVLFIALSAASGSVLRLFLTEKEGLPLFLSAAAASLLYIVLLYKTRLFIPPAGAVMLLAMLVPADRLLIYPVLILTGCGIFMLSAMGLDRIRNRRSPVPSQAPSAAPMITIPITASRIAKYCLPESFSFRKILAQITENIQ